MRVYLVRHGQTSYNRDGLGLGRTDAPLTALGDRQAALAAARIASFGVGEVFTSPLQRAAVLADKAAAVLGISAVRCDELLEMDVGETEGVPFPVIRKRYPEFFADWAGDGAVHSRMPGGESLADVDVRLAGFMHRLERDTGPDIAVITHNFVVRALLCRLMGVELASFRTFSVDLASIAVVSREHGDFSVEAINDTAHLASLERSSRQG